MAFSNEKFQIFFNQSPYMKKEGTEQPSFQSQYQNTSYDNMFNFTSNAGLQNTRYLNEIDPVNDARYHQKMNIGTNVLQTMPTFGHSYDLYAPENETIDCYKDTQSSSQEYDEEDKPSRSALSHHSKKIHKEKVKSSLKKKSLLLNKMKTKRNPWQPEEDEQVIDLVAKYGQSWALIASLMNQRSGKQIRDRYLNKLKPDINKAEWTNNEDELVMTLCKEIGHKWSRIATFLPGRTEGQVKNRFYSHIKKRMSKWNGPSSHFIKERLMEEEREMNNEKNGLESAIKEESSLKTEIKNKSIQMLNCAGDYKIVNSIGEKAGSSKLCASSINIKLNSQTTGVFGNGKSVVYNLVPAKKDPTDVISYIGSNKDGNSTADELNSPFSQKSEIHLSSTRASSLSQEKEFEEAFDKLSSNLVKPSARGTKLNGLSFSISNGQITSNPNPVKAAEPIVKPVSMASGNLSIKNIKEISQLNFSGVQNMINIKIC